MKLHEYQARALLTSAGVPVPAGEVCESVDAAVSAFERVLAAGAARAVIKAQVFAGGRGKAGFVKLVSTASEARSAAEFMLTHRMVSPQTPPEGISVRKLLVTAAVEIAKEFYVAIVLDRARSCPVVMVSTEGGVEIEEVAAKSPEKIFKQWLHPHLGLVPFQLALLVDRLGLSGREQVKGAKAAIAGLVDVFLKRDCMLAEINPLVLTTGGEVLAIDAKMNFDDNAEFRQQELFGTEDRSGANPLELRALSSHLAYVALDGNIGCLVNGAGLAMATMDIIKLHGGEPANFLDVGGGVTREGAVEAFRIVLSDSKVKAVLVNIFGGIARCDLIAEALIAAGKEVGFHVPVVVRLEGNNAEVARDLLASAQAELPTLMSAAGLTDAAAKVCDLVAR